VRNLFGVDPQPRGAVAGSVLFAGSAFQFVRLCVIMQLRSDLPRIVPIRAERV